MPGEGTATDPAPRSARRVVLGAVVIGRNEGPRLAACLASLQPRTDHIVYVDSGSTDDSLAIATAQGVTVVELDLSRPFTAARARNAGAERLLAEHPAVELIQFVDGDCELFPRWLEVALHRLADDPSIAVLCGRRRERRPEASVYNLLCDIEWNTPVGEALACGGDSLVRASAFREAGGFDDGLIAGEEPELCMRLRRGGWRVVRVAQDMTRHDADMTHFGQWWKRTKRAGYAFAAVSRRNAGREERLWVREARSALLWGALWPASMAALALPTAGASLVAGTALFFKPSLGAYRQARARGYGRGPARAYAFFLALAKLPEAAGVLRFHRLRLSGDRATLIEYK